MSPTLLSHDYSWVYCYVLSKNKISLYILQYVPVCASMCTTVCALQYVHICCVCLSTICAVESP